MLDNKGQSLIIFVLCLPIILLFFTYAIDIARVNYERNKMSNIIESSRSNNHDEICTFIKKNDGGITCNIENNTIFLEKKIKSLFGIIIKKEYYNVKVSMKI